MWDEWEEKSNVNDNDFKSWIKNLSVLAVTDAPVIPEDKYRARIRTAHPCFSWQLEAVIQWLDLTLEVNAANFWHSHVMATSTAGHWRRQMASINGQCRMGPRKQFRNPCKEVSAKHRNDYESIMRHEWHLSVYIGPAVYARWAQVGECLEISVKH